MGHIGAQGEDVGGAGGRVLQGRDPGHHKLYHAPEVIVADVVVKDMLLVHQSLTLHTCDIMGD